MLHKPILSLFTRDTAARRNAAWCAPSKCRRFGNKIIITRFLNFLCVSSSLTCFKQSFFFSSLIFLFWNKYLIIRVHSVRIKHKLTRLFEKVLTYRLDGIVKKENINFRPFPTVLIFWLRLGLAASKFDGQTYLLYGWWIWNYRRVETT